jgi:hypothetical protein
MKYLLTLLLTLPFSANACQYDFVLDTHKWVGDYQLPAAKVIYAQSFVSGRYVTFDQYKIILDIYNSGIKRVDRGESLNSVLRKANIRYIGMVEKVNVQTISGFYKKLDLYEVVKNTSQLKGCEVIR